MRTVTAPEFQKNFEAFKEIAQQEPVAITSNGRESVVLISVTDYKRFVRVEESKINPETEKMMDSFIERHRTVLEQLA